MMFSQILKNISEFQREFKFSSMVPLTNLIGLCTNQNIVDKYVA